MNTSSSPASGAQPPPGGAGSDRIDPALRRMTLTLIVGALAVIFDTTIMSVAIDNLAGQLHTSIDTIQWVSTAYLLSLSATMPAVGWAQSVLGGKRLWLVALAVFLVGSLLPPPSWSRRPSPTCATRTAR
jgi:MFS family permease